MKAIHRVQLYRDGYQLAWVAARRQWEITHRDTGKVVGVGRTPDDAYTNYRTHTGAPQ